MQALDLHSASISSQKDHTPGKVFLAKNDPSGYSKPVVQRKLLCMVPTSPAQAHGSWRSHVLPHFFVVEDIIPHMGCVVKPKPGFLCQNGYKSNVKTKAHRFPSGAGDGPFCCMGSIGADRRSAPQTPMDSGIRAKKERQLGAAARGGQIMYFLTVSDRASASTDREITKLMFSLAENLSSQARKVSRLSTDLSLTSL